MDCGALRFIARSIPKTHLDRIQASSVLDIINDYTRFVIAFFEVISTSAPHTYHSALSLSPSTSIVHNRYKQYARPLARVVWGAPASWEQSVATMYSDNTVDVIAWSPCSRFIAVARLGPNIVQLLDATTLGLLDVFQFPSDWLGSCPLLSFSPDSRSLTLYISGRIIAWDLQTGGKAADFRAEREHGSSSTYSIDGRFFAVLSWNPFRTKITTYDLLLGTRAGQFFGPTTHAAPPIWPHNECIRFATVENRYITISEVGFTSAHTPVEVESFPAPERFADARDYLFLPALSRLAFTLFEAIEIWDAQASRTLLECTRNGASMMSFSTDCHLFAYAANRCGEAHVWKESVTGYELHQRLPLAFSTTGRLVLSPSGRSIIMAGRLIYLLSIAGPILSRSSISRQSDQWTGFALAFSPDQSLAAIARLLEVTITVVNLKSGDRGLVVETGMMTCALGVIGSTLVVVGDGKAVTWTIPTGDDFFHARANINDSVRTTILDQPGLSLGGLFGAASISPVRNRIAVTRGLRGSGCLRVYDISAGRCLGGIETKEVGIPRFTPDGCEVWVVDPFEEGWAIVENGGSGLIKLEPLESNACPPGVFPWRPSRSHHVSDGGWVLNSAQE